MLSSAFSFLVHVKSKIRPVFALILNFQIKTNTQVSEARKNESCSCKKAGTVSLGGNCPRCVPAAVQDFSVLQK